MRRLHRHELVAAGLAVAILLGGGVVLAGTRAASATAGRHDQGQTCLGAATAAAQAIFSYDYSSFDASVAKGSSFTTGDFTAEYAQTTASLKPVAVQQQAVVRAEVSAAGVVDVQPGRVELLLYVNQYRRNTAITGEKVDQNRVVLTMVPDGSTCKVAKAEAI
jgi:Mce-associated membrane protein